MKYSFNLFINFDKVILKLLKIIRFKAKIPDIQGL